MASGENGRGCVEGLLVYATVERLRLQELSVTSRSQLLDGRC